MKSDALYRILLKDGWYVVSQTGSHMKMAHPTKKSSLPSDYLIVPYHGSAEVGKGLASKILKEAGLR